jgi:hypothetical protein
MVYGQGEVSSNLDLFPDTTDFLAGINSDNELYQGIVSGHCTINDQLAHVSLSDNSIQVVVMAFQ